MFKFAFHLRRSSRTRDKRQYRPRIEGLEDRATPTGSMTAVATFPKTGPFLYGSPIVDSQGNLFALEGTSATVATVIKIAAGSHAISTVATLGASTGAPNAHIVLDSAGNIYGTTSSGGVNGDGSVFKIPVGSHTVQTLASFAMDTTGWSPDNLVLANGFLYGATKGFYNGGTGSSSNGTVFKLAVGGGAIQTVAKLDSNSGINPTELTLNGGVIYGVATSARLDGTDVVFSVPVGGGSAKLLGSFNGEQHSDSHLVVSNGRVYGTMETSPSFNGSVFSFPIAGGAITTWSFNGSNGSMPVSGLFMNGSSIVGITQGGGSTGEGTLFSFNPANGAITDLNQFHGGTIGGVPFGKLAIDSHGNIYGSSSGENDNSRIIWELSAAPVSTLSFSGNPAGGLASQALPAIKVSMTNAPAGSSVTLKLGSNPTGATLSGNRTAQVVNGVATFTGLTINKPGVKYTLVATSGALSATSSAFTVGPQLVFKTQPPANVHGKAPFAISVVAKSPSGAVATSFTGQVTLTLWKNGASTGTSFTVKAVKGVAVFKIIVRQLASGYTLVATSSGALSTTSGSFNDVR